MPGVGGLWPGKKGDKGSTQVVGWGGEKGWKAGVRGWCGVWVVGVVVLGGVAGVWVGWGLFSSLSGRILVPGSLLPGVWEGGIEPKLCGVSRGVQSPSPHNAKRKNAKGKFLK